MNVFVFGSNLAGRHGKGAALEAIKKWGAVYGKGAGRQGVSYAIPTKDFKLRPLPLVEIGKYVEEFLRHAEDNPDVLFNLTKVGCGLAGYKEEDIAPMFEASPPNVIKPEGW